MDLATQTIISTGDKAAFASPRPQSSLIDATHPRRADVEAFIAQRFLEVHGASISSFMPQLLALFGDQDQVLAAVGVRSADREPLFLEYYLDIPIEQAIGKFATAGVARAHIAEIGNLASCDRPASRRLFQLLARHLYAHRFEWAVYTGCSSLHRMFAALGIETLALGRALQARLPREQQTWGGYYEDNPQVVAGRVDCGRAVFENLEVAA